jgi:Protein of unknown function (DUF5133)
MLMPEPAELSVLVQRYEALRTRHESEPSAESLRCLNDAAATLCESTGARDVGTALVLSRILLAASGNHSESG